MKVFITGADGQLGRALQKRSSEYVEIIPFTSKACNIVDKKQVRKCICNIKPDIVIHCAAYTAVDQAEIEQEACRSINIDGTKNVALACEETGASLMLLSSDYVFNGLSSHPYEIEDRRDALNQYGRSKIEAENIVTQLKKHFVIRTSWMFGDGSNFVKTICRLGLRQHEVRVVADQLGSPTFAEDIAPLIIDIAKDYKYGTYHITNEGYCSWADLASESFRLLGIDAKVSRIMSYEYASLAKRPKNSRLSKKSLDEAGYCRLPTWQDALSRYIWQHGESIYE